VEGSIPIWLSAPILSAIIAALAATLATILTHCAQTARLRAEFGTEQSAEAAIRQLLELNRLPYRSFQMIRHHIGGFESNEPRNSWDSH
jgi:hypothetical protein